MADCFWDNQVLALSSDALAKLPEDVLRTLSSGTNEDYLQTLANLILDPSWTEVIFCSYQPLFLDLVGRLIIGIQKGTVSSLESVTALSKVLPFCPQLASCIREITSGVQPGIFCSIGQRDPTFSLLEISTDQLYQLLMLLLRLLRPEQHEFSSLVSPIQMQELCSHAEHHIQYLACRVLGLLFHFTDRTIANHVEQYCGTDSICATVDGREIDLRYLDVWESQRLQRLQKLVENKDRPQEIPSAARTITHTDLCLRVTNFAGYLAVSPASVANRADTIVMCPTATQNLKKVAESICSKRATLLIGSAGSGKSLLVDQVAERLEESERMLTLHLNSQTDAKLLIGLHTSVPETGAFKWQPGVLTRAILEGRWVLIEDLDRATSEVMGVLLPLLDTGQLMVPNFGGMICAAPGFKLIGTIRVHAASQAHEAHTSHILGIRHWHKVLLQQYDEQDLQEIITTTFPLLRLLSHRIINMYKAIDWYAQHIRGSQSGLKSPGLLELLRFCTKASHLLQENGMMTESDAFPGSLTNQLFLEAIESFCGGLPFEAIRLKMTDIIAKELHISAETVRFCVELRVSSYEQKIHSVKYGRVELQLHSPVDKKIAGRSSSKGRPFAKTNHSLRILESVASAVKYRTPCLLVGETGTGKTTIIQELAGSLGQKLFVVNLSQQSEVSDLFGGFKPVTLRALASPIEDCFDALFEATLKSNKNEKFLTSLARYIKKGEWARVARLWQEASKTAVAALEKQAAKDEQPSKKRKTNDSGPQRLISRWQKLSSDIEAFRKHAESGSKGFAFSYVEGNLVKAVRRGHWILLDEINLAPSDTLESLLDLLQADVRKAPSLLLSDSGDIHRITAHSNFRIFAAMNPATDIGKRDLPPGIRSRFEELYVSSCDNDFDSLIQICSAYLGDFALSDRWVVNDVTKLYQSIRELEKSNDLVDGAGQRPHFTLRSFSRTLMHATDTAKLYGLRRSLYEGFCMSFLTLLDKASVDRVSPLIFQHLLASQKNIKSILHQTPKCPGEAARYVQFKHYWMTRGPLDPVEQPHYIITPFVEANLLNLVRATTTKRYPILLQGPTSSGKTSMIEYLAKISGNRFVRINNHEHTDLQEYLGSYISGPQGLTFQDGVLVKALREGHWLVLDELNLAPTDILEALNRLLDDNRELLVSETQEIVRPHPDFMLFATQNPPGLYGGRKVLSRAFRNRFLELHFDDIPENELETILRERSQIAPSFCTKIVEVYKRLAILRQTNRLFEQKNSFATLRDLFRWAFRDADNIEQLAINGFMLLCERVRDPAERTAVKSIIEEIMKVKIDESKLYTLDDAQKNSIRSGGSFAGGISMTKAMSRLYILVRAALRSKEPVLLIGNTGCGKTTVCQIIAESIRVDLHILNAHQNTEAGDIIGAQRPIRNRQQIDLDLLGKLQDLLQKYPDASVQPEASLDDMLVWYEDFKSSVQRENWPEQRHEVEKLISKRKALFEWADGSLVTAMRAGHYFLMDEISLADDSVLERLNSILESSRSLLLAEKGGEDTMVVAHDDFQFLATMNPGGDYGKKELSPALRNRFTEIWCPDLDDEDDALNIVAARLVDPLKPLAQPIVAFSRWFEFEYGDNKTALSLRQILAWIEFLNLRSKTDADIGHSIVHGAAMVYIDGIGTDPSAKLYLSQAEAIEKRSACLDQLTKLFHFPARDIYYTISEVYIQSETLFVDPFALKGNKDTMQNTNFSLESPTTRRNALRVVRGLQIAKPILIEGSPGVGKTSLIENLARMLGIALTRINLSEQTDLMDLFGSDVPVENGSPGQFQWRDAPFLTAMQKGEWVLLDEMNLASQSVLEGLNACLDHRGQVYVPELDRYFTKHSNFVLFAAQNSHAQGGGRKGLPASFVNRFTLVYAESLSTEDMIQISASMFPNIDLSIVQALASYLSNLNSFLDVSQNAVSAGGPWEFNLRDMLRWLILLSKKKSILEAAAPGHFEDMLVLGRFRNLDAIEDVKAVVHSPFPDSSRSRTRFRNFGSSFMQCGFGLWQKSFLGSETAYVSEDQNLVVLESVMIAVEQNWPCLLVGPSGSGKSRLLHGLASTYGADVINLALNSETDTMDILGGYEQVDYTRHFKSLVLDITQELRHYWAESKSEITNPALGTICSILDSCSSNPSLLLDRLRTLVLPGLSKYKILVQQLDQLLQRVQNHQQTGFEWVDGVLVRAMERGSWVILDNANLCNASVLDRLNALLEPDGDLSLNEHRLADGSPRFITRHPNFRLFLTMDPRHGELSRAMRNRCVELYQPVLENSRHSSLVDFAQSLLQTGLNVVPKLEGVKIPDSQLRPLFELVLSRLPFVHHQEAGVLLQQLLESYEVSTQAVSSIDKALRIMAAAHYPPGLAKLLQKLYAKFSDLTGLDAIFSADILNQQPMDITANSALLSMQMKSNRLDFPRAFYDFVDARQKLGRLQYELHQIQENLPQNQSNPTELEKSMLVSTNRKFSTRPIAVVNNILEAIIEDLEENLDVEIMAHSSKIQAIKQVLQFCQDLLEFTHQHSIDIGRFFTFIRLGFALCQEQGLSHLQHQLLRFGNVSVHQDMEAFWQYFKPSKPEFPGRLMQAAKLEGINSRFDKVMWRTTSSLLAIAELKVSLSSINSGDEVVSWDHLQEIEGLVHEQETSKDLEPLAVRPYFENTLAGLRQYRALGASDAFWRKLDYLDVLAGDVPYLSYKDDDPDVNRTVLLFLPLLVGSMGHDTYLGVIRGDFSANLLSKLREVDNVSLRQLSRLQEEFPVLCKQISTTITRIDDKGYWRVCILMGRLLLDILKAHRHLLDISKFTGWSEWLQTLLDRERIHFPSSSLPALAAVDSSASHQASSIQSLLQEFLDLLARVAGIDLASTKDWKAMGNLWLRFASTCLKLYVPGHPFDPALGPVLMHHRWLKRKGELEDEIAALELYESATYGQPVDFRRQMLLENLSLLGPEPKTLAIFRPDKSQIADLHREFLNIKQTVLTRLEDDMFSESFDNGKRIYDMRAHVQANIKRLTIGYEAYQDITKPAIGLLRALDIGLTLSSLSHNTETMVARYATSERPLLSLFGLDVRRILENTSHCSLSISSLALDHRYLRLSYIRLHRNIHGYVDDDEVMVAASMLESFYQEWKENLSQAQMQETAKSSLYQFQDKEELSDHDDAALSTLFPTFDREEGQPVSGTAGMSPSALAHLLADLQAQIFSNCDTSTNALPGLMTDFQERILEAYPPSATSFYPIRNTDQLPSLLLALDKKQQFMTNVDLSSGTSDFYNESDLIAANKLVTLARKLRLRFRFIQEAWPEHAVPGLVLQTVEETLDCGHAEPLAKLISLAEKLHGYVHEWQSVASLEFSAAGFYDELTQLIISWRKIELSSWSRLLDREDTKQSQEAMSWWFIAYEAIIHPVRHSDISQEEISTFAIQLSSELQTFMKTTTLGQFATRLRMLESCGCQAHAMANFFSVFDPIAKVLASTVDYFARWQTKIEDEIKQQRQSLDAKMKDIILLASWKDVNIEALRASSRRSHLALFKVVKKYREVLARVVGPFLDPVEGSSNQPARKSTISPLQLDSDTRAAVAVCRARHTDLIEPLKWAEDPTGVATIMARIGKIPETEFRPIIWLDSFFDHLRTNIKSLQQETPTTLTDENKTTVKHLKARKRNLLADTLKELRRMGIRSNLDLETLRSQSTTPRILATVTHRDQLSAGKQDFHAMIDNISQIRSHTMSAADDLTANDVARCTGFVDGILFQLISQHKSIETSLQELNRCDSILKRIHESWQPAKYSVLLAGVDEITGKTISARLRWIKTILGSSRQLMTIFGRMGEENYTDALDDMRSHEATIDSLLFTIKEQPDLSSVGLATSMQVETIANTVQNLHQISLSLAAIMQKEPRLGFIVEYILPWLDMEKSLEDPLLLTGILPQNHESHANGVSEPRERSFLDIDNTVKQLQVGLQHYKTLLEALPKSNMEAGWLMTHDECLKKAASSMRVSLITNKIASILDPNAAGTDQGLAMMCATGGLLLPILQEYRNSYAQIINYRMTGYLSLCRLANLLTASLKQILAQGFCTPKESTKEKQDTSQTEGVGLGEGEGAEDISKDIQDDEDMEELAQNAQGKQHEDSNDQEIDKEDDAVDLGAEDLEGQLDEEGEERETGDDNEEEERGSEDMSEEVGQVDDLDPSAVDEKLWEEETKKEQREKEGKAAGKQQDTNDPDAQANEEDMGSASEMEDNHEVIEEHTLESEDKDAADPHVNKGTNLDLPEDIRMDDTKSLDPEEDSLELSDADDQEAEDGEAELGSSEDEDTADHNKSDDLADASDREAGQDENEIAEDNAEDNAQDNPEPQHDLTSKPDNSNTSHPDDQQGSGIVAEQQENTDETAGGTHHDKSASTDDIEAENSDLAKTATQHGNLAQDKLEPSHSETDREKQVEETAASTNPFRKLGEALERWQRSRAIHEASQTQNSEPSEQHEDLQHLTNKNDESNAQVLGPAAEDEVHALSKDELDMEVDAAVPESETKLNGMEMDAEAMEQDDTNDAATVQPEKTDTFIGHQETEVSGQDMDTDMADDHREANAGEIIDEIDSELSEIKLQVPPSPTRSIEKARKLWQQCEAATKDLSLILTEQLRLILAPSLATKMRGDFRTGKRLNIKRIIPYIASGYKRDKIWMRRSVPSKRSYQVMLAVDDSKSMAESGGSKLAFETLALLSRSLNMLEVGQIAIASFGESFRMAHAFEQQFSAEAAVGVFQHFTFRQTRTNVHNLMAQSLQVFRDARLKQAGSSADLWQLQLIISDGVCEDHGAIRRLVRQAHEERIMVVFAIINSAGNHSILDMTQASFEPDENGETKLRIKRYLEGFPFPYYLIVGDVKNLPGVLSTALRQWFAEVVDS